MNGDQSHPHDLLAAYLLGAVDADEAAWIARHLATCAACRAIAAELRPAVDDLATLAGEVDPPPGLKARVMAAVAADTAAQPARPHAAGNGHRPAPPDNRAPVRELGQPAGVPVREPADGSGEPAEARPAMERLVDVQMPAATRVVRRRPWAVWTALAALVALACLGIGLWRLVGPASPVVRTPTVVVALAGGSLAPHARGSLRYYASDHRLELAMRGLPALPAGHFYALWLVRGHYRLVRREASFAAPHSGTIDLVIQGENPLHYTLTCLTAERVPRPTRPTLPAVALSQITG